MTTTATPQDEAQVDPDAIRERGQGLELHTKRGLHTGRPAYMDYVPEMRKLIKDSLLPAEATDADLYMLLELAATYKLDPFAKELWAVKMPGRNAAQGGYLTIMVGRDGLLAIAERHPDYRGYRCQAYYEKDEVIFHSDPRQMPDGTWSHFEHSFSLNAERGELRGAWSEVYRADRPTVWFDAKLGEYDKSDNDYSPWRKQKTVMIEKCALVTALRHSFRISGLYIADEMTNALLAPTSEREKIAGADGWNWGEDIEVKNRLADLFAVLHESYMPAKQRLVMAGLDDDGRRALIQQLEQECEAAGIAVPAPRDPDEEVVPENETEVMDEEPKPEQTPEPATPTAATEPEAEPEAGAVEGGQERLV